MTNLYQGTLLGAGNEEMRKTGFCPWGVRGEGDRRVLCHGLGQSTGAAERSISLPELGAAGRLLCCLNCNMSSLENRAGRERRAPAGNRRQILSREGEQLECQAQRCEKSCRVLRTVSSLKLVEKERKI